MKPLAALFALVFSGSALGAGPWLAEPGQTFTAFSSTLNYFLDVGRSTYVEHGLRQDLTVGADLHFATDRFGVRDGAATLFIRRQLPLAADPHRFAYELGLGARWDDTATLPHAQVGLSWGRGLTWGERSGWATVETSLRVGLNDDERLFKLDGTLGLDLSPRVTVMGQVFLYQTEHEAGGSFAPSLVVRYEPETKNRIQIGLVSPFDNRDDTAVKIGLWRSF